jgi:phosphonate transport system substrate-binding protein
MAARRLVLGAVAYDPKVVTIWEGFSQWMGTRGVALDFVLFSSYERQVEAQLRGVVDVAWSSPLAWIETERAAKSEGRAAQAIAMRDTDRDLHSVVLVRGDSQAHALDDLRGRRIAVGACDSPQATLIPLLMLAEAGLEPARDLEVVRFDVGVGLHGDHVGGERDAARALVGGRVDAACVIDTNVLAFSREGTLPPGATRVLATTPAYDHCNMTVLDGAPDTTGEFARLLLDMRWEDPAVRRLLELEGLRQWLPARVSGYAQLERAVDRFGTRLA